MNSFILFLSILIILVSICLIIFNNRSVLSNTELPNTDYDAKTEQEISSFEEQRSEQNNFEKVFQGKIEPELKFGDSFIDKNINASLINEVLIKNTEAEENTKNFNKVSDTDKMIKEINELKQLGFSNQEIAKKLGRGVREIDIILKIDNLKSISSSKTDKK